MTKELTQKTETNSAGAIEQVLIGGDLAALNSEQRLSYYNKVCESLGLNPLTQPFAYINLNGKLRLYALKDCTEQLRNRKSVSISIVSREVTEGIYVVTARATDSSGRSDEAIGAVPIDKAVGEGRANAIMKAETKAKRRVTLSFCGLGMLDETEAESIPGAVVAPKAGSSVDAEVVPPAAEKSDLPKASPDQIKVLCTLMAKLKIKERPAVMVWINKVIAPRVVESRLDLTPAEASKCIETAETELNDAAKE